MSITHNKDGTVEVVTDKGMFGVLAADAYQYLLEAAARNQRSVEDQLQWMYDDLESKRVKGKTVHFKRFDSEGNEDDNH